MKKKILYTILIIGMIGSFTIWLKDKTKNIKKEEYETVYLEDYKFQVRKDYLFQKREDEFVFNSEFFYSSHIYIINESYSNAIAQTAHYTLGGAIQKTSEQFDYEGKYKTYFHQKEVYYQDINERKYLTILLVSLNEKKTLVFVYEVEDESFELANVKEMKKIIDSIEKV